MTDPRSGNPTCCGIDRQPDYSGIDVVEADPQPGLQDYREAMKLGDAIADDKLGDFMMLSWYDRDRDFESPRHAGECHQDGAVPGYVDYGIHHGARLKVDIHGGRFVFFYLPLDG